MKPRSIRPLAVPLTLGLLVVTLSSACGGDGRPKEPVKGAAAHTLPADSTRADTLSFSLTSAAFTSGRPIPTRHTGDGEDVSPALAWSGAPDSCAELALIVDDPDAPTPTPWVHWVIYKIPGAATGLPEKLPRDARLTAPAGALQGRNSWNAVGWRGPSPPPGKVHHYHFRLYALDAALPLEPGMDKATLLLALDGHVLAQTELVGTYAR